MQYVGIQTQQSRNNIRSAFLLFLFPCLVTALLYLSCYLLVLFGYGKSMEVEMMPMVNHFFLSSLPYTLGVVAIWFLIAYWANTRIINSATGSKPLDRKENKRVYNLVENLCMSQGMSMPKINIIHDNSLNAFASGINDRTYTITLSRGIIQKLNDEELEAVIGHELTHIRNRDVRLLIISIVFVGIFSMLTEITFYTITHIRVRSNSKGSAGIFPLYDSRFTDSCHWFPFRQPDAFCHFAQTRIYGRRRFGRNDEKSVGTCQCFAKNICRPSDRSRATERRSAIIHSKS